MPRWGTVALVLAAAAALAGGASAFPGLRPNATVRLKECSREDHTAVFYARMRHIPGAHRMWMRFTLLERRDGSERFERVSAPGLGRWRKSNLGVPSFGYRQRVRGLTEGSAYRMLVNFRWYGDADELIWRTRRRSRACRQLDAPNLRARVMSAEPTSFPGDVRYAVRVRNVGVQDATRVAVRLAVDGEDVDTIVLARLRGGESQFVHFRGPSCKQQVAAKVDPENAIEESDEHDNRHVALCGSLEASR
jgi:hypothetical protein